MPGARNVSLQFFQLHSNSRIQSGSSETFWHSCYSLTYFPRLQHWSVLTFQQQEVKAFMFGQPIEINPDRPEVSNRFFGPFCVKRQNNDITRLQQGMKTSVLTSGGILQNSKLQ